MQEIVLLSFDCKGLQTPGAFYSVQKMRNAKNDPFRLEDDFSKLLHREQMHYPITMLVQNFTSRLSPKVTTLSTMAEKL